MTIARAHKIFLVAVVNIAFLFAGAMMYTYLGEWLGKLGFFGDAPCADNHCGLNGTEEISWGMRHYLYAWMSFTLGIVNFIRTAYVIMAYMDVDK
jgi:hypothetical protein